MSPAVIGRIKIDNSLLSLPHADPKYDKDADVATSGGLIDVSDYGRRDALL